MLSHAGLRDGYLIYLRMYISLCGLSTCSPKIVTLTSLEYLLTHRPKMLNVPQTSTPFFLITGGF